MFVKIAVNTKSSKRDDLFTYEIPEEIRDTICMGQLVIVPLGPRSVNGIVIEIEKSKPDFETKKIIKIVDETPVVDQQQIELAKFISEYYWCGFSQALFAMLPINLRKRRTSIFKKAGSQKISNFQSCLPAGRFPISNQAPMTNAQSNPKSKISKLKLTDYQQKALDKIVGALESGKPETFLLHGVTNSGKTEVYLRSFAKALENGGSGIYIVPEIALTPQAIKRFEEVFGGEQVALIHSGLSIAEKLRTWIDIKTGKKRIVVGSRSAIFAPLQNLKIIIVDEEHDLISFKSDQAPRYELHKVSEKLAEISSSVLIFGSATPLVTSYARVLDGGWGYLSLSERIDKSIPPQIKVVNMNEEKSKGGDGVFSEYLIQALDLVLKNKKQALLFLNRRGMASFIICNDCKKVSMCESCDSALVFHSIDNKLWCHHCGRKYPVPTRCGVCGGLDFRFLGRGTERIETEIKKYFPSAKIARMDRDTMTDGKAYQDIFEKYKAGEIDILIGTQMIVHGWDIPSVDLAAVISIDESLLLPDYQSEEKVFELLTQLAGRTGRSGARGMMVLQTYNPDLLLFDCVVKNDYLSFVKRELALREKFSYPPFGQVIKLSLGGVKKEIVEKKAEELVEKLNLRIQNSEFRIEVIGPIAPLIEKKYNRYWRTIVIKFTQSNPAKQFDGVKKVESYKVREELLNLVPKEWVVDVDPMNLL